MKRKSPRGETREPRRAAGFSPRGRSRPIAALSPCHVPTFPRSYALQPAALLQSETAKRGFTLVELVLVITLTMILAAGAVSGLRGLDSWRASAAVRRIQADLAYARDVALLSARRTLCVIDLDKMTYEIQQEAVPSSAAIVASVIDHPLTKESWQVTLSELSRDLRINSVSGLDPPTIGFGSEGVLVNSSGKPLKKDVELTFSSGARLTLRAGSGLCEVRWP